MGGDSWEFSDAWLMVAVAGHGHRGCDLTELIASADGYNHDIPTEPIVRRSIGRLTESGLMRVSGDRVRLTRDGRALASRVDGRMFERAPNLLKLLQEHALREGSWELRPGAWQEAYDRYRARMANR